MGPILSFLDPKRIQAHRIAETIIKASKDSKVTGLVVNARNIDGDFALLGEIRDAVQIFRDAGKKTFFFAHAMSEVGSGTLFYWFASVFEEIHMCKTGLFNVVAFSGVQPFFRQMLDKIEAEPSVVARKEYKNAMNNFMFDKFTDEHRESTEHLLNSIYGRLVQDVASSRNLDVNTVRKLFDEGPLSAVEAKEAGLVDNLCYEDEFYGTHLVQAFNVLNKKKLRLLYLERYRSRVGGLYTKGKDHIAVVHIDGPILEGRNEGDLFGEEEAYSENICDAIRDATEDKRVKIILLRVSSPGGSALASDMIARTVKLAKEKGKKIYVSMGQVAASGGYYVSAYANRIFATPYTITGSIGVIGGKFKLKKTFNKIGVTFDEIETGESSHFYSSLSSYEEKNTERVNKIMDDIYDTFKAVVSEGRRLTDDQTEELARGRAWVANQDIKDRGLIDEIGGFHYALEMAKKELGLTDKDSIVVRTYPRAPGLLSLIKPERNSQKTSLGSSIMVIFSAVRVMNQFLQVPQLRTLLSTLPLMRMKNLSEVTMSPSMYCTTSAHIIN